MRNLTDKEKGELEQRCICCKATDFYIGPQGGLSFNIYCAKCLAGFNVTHKQLPWQLLALPGDRTMEELQPVLKTPAVSATEIHSTLSAAIEHGLSVAFDKARGRVQ